MVNMALKIGNIHMKIFGSEIQPEVYTFTLWLLVWADIAFVSSFHHITKNTSIQNAFWEESTPPPDLFIKE